MYFRISINNLAKFQFLSLFYRLGRNECLDDLWIAGDFKIEKIAVEEVALEETKKLTERAEKFEKESFFATEDLLIGFLNVLKAVHRDGVFRKAGAQDEAGAVRRQRMPSLEKQKKRRKKTKNTPKQGWQKG